MSRHTDMFAHPRRALLVAAMLLCAFTASHAAPEPIVIGQSLPLTGAGFPVANRVLAGARAHVERINASGGILGRPVELVTLDDGGDPARVAVNLRTLVRQRNALLIANCLGERACLGAAQAARELRVPLVGPMSGASALRAPDVHHVFSLRPDDAREADALARQLGSVGISKVAVLADDSEPARTAALVAALQRSGQQVTRITAGARLESIEKAFQDAAKAAPQALVLNLGNEVLDALGRLPASAYDSVPSTVATLSTSGLTQLTRLFRNRLVGYTSVVPNPEVARLPIVRELERDADAFIGPEALTFEGLESYLNLRVCTEALRRAGPRADGQRLGEAIESLGALDLGGFKLSFSRERHQASDHVEIGMRARDGRLLR